MHPGCRPLSLPCSVTWGKPLALWNGLPIEELCVGVGWGAVVWELYLHQRILSSNKLFGESPGDEQIKGSCTNGSQAWNLLVWSWGLNGSLGRAPPHGPRPWLHRPCLVFLQPGAGTKWWGAWVSKQLWQSVGRVPVQVPFYSWEGAPQPTHEDTEVPPQVPRFQGLWVLSRAWSRRLRGEVRGTTRFGLGTPT